MRFTRTALVFIILIIIVSVFIANVTNLISVDNNLAKRINKNEKWDSASWFNNQNNIKIDDSPDHLMWFLQISDLHISIFRDADRVKQLEIFVNKTIKTIQPSVVLASGDLTDARSANHLGSEQFEEEWKIYYEVLTRNNITSNTLWLDIRGNHDNFNVPGLASSINYFTNYSIQGHVHKKSYMYQVTKGKDKFTFIAVDACLEPGPKRPFNFIGMISIDEMENIIDLVNKARHNGGNYTIWFGHYPTSCILAPGAKGIRGVIGQYDESVAYLCGHLHTMGGMVPHMYTLQHDGFLELELGDWKDNRIFRLGAIDHGLFSFTDLHHNEWPVVLITNPKHILFNIPGKENPNLQMDSTHIRLLAFSLAPIVKCKIRIDSKPFMDCERVTENLFVLQWNPHLYRKSIHHIEVEVVDREGRRKIVKQPFSLNGSRLSFNLLPRLVLMSDACTIFQGFFIIALAICILPLIIFRIWHILVLYEKAKRPRIRCGCFRNWVRKMWLLSTVDRLFYPIILFCLYIAIGPWSVGDLIDDHMGVIFVWGIFVGGTFLPGSLTYLYGFFQLILCEYPLIHIYANAIDRRFRKQINPDLRRKSFLVKWLLHTPFFFIIIVEIILAYFFWLSYGILAFFLGPLRTWSIVLNIFLWYQAHYSSDKCLESGAAVWLNEPKLVMNREQN